MIPPNESSPERTREQRALAFVLAAVLALMIFLTLTSRRGQELPRLERSAERAAQYKVDPNEAGVVELACLPGIGPVLARRILDDRLRRGRFRSIEDLQRVRGIGPKLIERIRPYLELRSSEAPATDSGARGPR